MSKKMFWFLLIGTVLFVDIMVYKMDLAPTWFEWAAVNIYALGLFNAIIRVY